MKPNKQVVNILDSKSKIKSNNTPSTPTKRRKTRREPAKEKPKKDKSGREPKFKMRCL